MLDRRFKKLLHRSKGYSFFKKGGELAKGYKPDYVLKKGNSYIIYESEHGSSRKHFIGGLIKAARFLIGNRKGVLVYVILRRKNTTVEQIANHLVEYYEWIKTLTNLKEVYVLYDTDYCRTDTDVPLETLSKEFKKKATSLNA